MTNSGKSGGTRKGAAARREADDEAPKPLEWRGLEFTLPVTLPASAAFDLAGASGAFGDIMFLASVLGPEQTRDLRAKLDADGVALDEEGTQELGGLVESVCEAFGLTAGESEASPAS